jgi:methyl-accepting chemotaxis protein
MFVDAAYRQSPEYRLFWEKLGRGEYDTGQYRRIAKGGRDVWIQASYNPIFDANGKPFKVVKFATDITQQKLQNADFEGQLAAISKAQAVIEFSLDGKVLNANSNFLNVLGYTLDEIKGHHHSMFVEPSHRQSAEYRMFWEKLGRGEYDAGQYKRIGKGGTEVWIQASYNPILDANGKPFKVVKYATDITANVKARRPVLRRERPDRHHDERGGENPRLGARSIERIRRNLGQHDRSVAAYRGTGGEPRRNLGFDGGNVGDCEEECRQRPAG